MKIKCSYFQKSPLAKSADEDTLGHGGVVFRLHVRRQFSFRRVHLQTYPALIFDVVEQMLLKIDRRLHQHLANRTAIDFHR